MKRREFLVRSGTAAAPALGSLTVAAPRRVAAQPARDLVIAVASDINTLDPQESTVAADVRITLNLFDTLVTRAPDLTLLPALATSWRRLDDRRWELTLRDDAHFHTGEPVTARDVKFTIERAISPTVGTAVVTIFSSVDAVTVVDDRTVVIETFYSDPLLPARLAYTGGEILPERYVTEVGAGTFSRMPVGSGVVQFESWAPGQRLVLKATPTYWGGPPAFDRVIFRVMNDAHDRVHALLDGNAHIATRIAPAWRLRISRRAEARPVEALYAGQYVVAVNVRVPPLNDARIRQALSLAVDRKSILGGCGLGGT